jgi:hypothetical protein
MNEKAYCNVNFNAYGGNIIILVAGFCLMEILNRKRKMEGSRNVKLVLFLLSHGLFFLC